MKKVFTNDTKNEKERVRGIRNNDIWENGMGMVATRTLHSEDLNGRIRDMSMNKVNKMTMIEGKGVTVMLRATKRANF